MYSLSARRARVSMCVHAFLNVRRVSWAFGVKGRVSWRFLVADAEAKHDAVVSQK